MTPLIFSDGIGDGTRTPLFTVARSAKKRRAKREPFSPIPWPCGMSLHLLKMCETLDKFLGAASRKAHGQPPVFLVTFYADDGSDAIIRMPDLLTEQGIGR